MSESYNLTGISLDVTKHAEKSDRHFKAMKKSVVSDDITSKDVKVYKKHPDDHKHHEESKCSEDSHDHHKHSEESCDKHDDYYNDPCDRRPKCCCSNGNCDDRRPKCCCAYGECDDRRPKCCCANGECDRRPKCCECKWEDQNGYDNTYDDHEKHDDTDDYTHEKHDHHDKHDHSYTKDYSEDKHHEKKEYKFIVCVKEHNGKKEFFINKHKKPTLSIRSDRDYIIVHDYDKKLHHFCIYEKKSGKELGYKFKGSDLHGDYAYGCKKHSLAGGKVVVH